MKALLAIFLFLLPVLPAPAAYPYKVEDIPLPENAPPEVGGLDFAPDGTLFVVLRRGDVLRTTPKAGTTAFDWQLFATGFHNGCGIHALSRDKVRVTQMAEFTEAEDRDGDGTADAYRRFSSGWGLSGNYHETNTLTGDGKGGYYLSIGTASHNGPTFEHTLGEYSRLGRRGRNYSAVKWRGWVLHCDDQGRLTPFASGFRMHNGLYRDPQGNLWAGDNQGDWRATTPLYHIGEGNFYGHPSSLVWDERWPKDKDPLATYRKDLQAYNEHRTHPAVQIPHKEMNRSASEPMEIPEAFGTFAGQLILPDNNGTRITRVMLEKVQGRFQGACTHFLTNQGLRSGNNRVRFSPDGKQLYVGQTVRGWGKLAEGLQRLTPTGEAPFDIEKFGITPKGFRLTFTQPLPESALAPETYAFTSFTYQSKWTYGSPQEDKKDHGLDKVRVLDEYTVELALNNFSAGRVYQLKLPKLVSTEQTPLQNRLFYYTANKLP